MQHLASTLSLAQRLVLWQLLLFAGGLLVWSQRRLAPGALRLAVALPLLALNVAAPLLFDGEAELILNISSFIASTAVTNMKLLGWAMDRGSLVLPLTRGQFLAVYALPITPAEAPEAGQEGEEAQDSQAKRPRRGRVTEARSAGTHFRHFMRKAVGLAGVIYCLNLYASGLPRPFRTVLQGLSQYLSLSMSMDVLAALVGVTTGLAVSPHFDNPYKSTSVANFWNERWNLTVSNVLRASVYDPIMEGRLVRRPGAPTPFSRTRRTVGVLTVFLVSGIMHEALFWSFAHRFSPHGMWLMYFVLWGVFLVAENAGKKLLQKRGLAMPTLLARILTLIVVNAMVAALWWPPVDQLGVPQRATQQMVDFWRTLHKQLLGRWRV